MSFFPTLLHAWFQRKRLSIALEILDAPDLIFMDEPISGLDTSTAHSTMEVIANITNGIRTTLVTIHQVIHGLHHTSCALYRID